MGITRTWIEAAITAFFWFTFGYVLFAIFTTDIQSNAGSDGVVIYQASLLSAIGLTKQLVSIGGVIYMWSLFNKWADNSVAKKVLKKKVQPQKMPMDNVVNIAPSTAISYGLKQHELIDMQKKKSISIHFDKNLGLAKVVQYHIH